MRNFSSDPNKPAFMDEAPAFVKFFLDQRRPKWQRGGALALAVFIFLLPLFSSGSHRSEKVAKPTEAPSEKGVSKSTDETAESDGAPQNAKAMLANEAIEPGVFRNIPGPYPVLVSIANGPKDSVWITSVQDVFEFKGTEGAKKLDPSSYENVFDNELPSMTASLLDENGEIWTGSKDGQLMHYTNYDWKIVFKAKDPISERIFSIGKKDNSVFLGTASGLWRWDMSNGKLTRFRGFAGQLISAFTKDRDENLFLAAASGIWKFTEQGWAQVFPFRQKIKVNSLAFDNTNTLLVASDEGIMRVDLAKGTRKIQLASTAISSLQPDGPGLWATSLQEGLRYFDGEKWFGLSEEEGLPGNHISHVHADASGSLWLGVAGKGPFRGNTREVLDWIKKHPIEDIVPDPSKPRLYKNACKAVEAEFKKTNVSGDIAAVSMNNQPVVFFRGAQICPSGVGYRADNGVVVMLKGKELVVAAGENVQRIAVPDKFPVAEFKKMYLDSFGRIWIARNVGALMFQNGNWADGKDDPILAGNAVQAFAEDKNKIFWMGTAPVFNETTREYSQPSLHAFNGTGWLHRSFEQGLPGYSVTSLVPLRSGGVLVGTPSSFAVATPEKIKLLTGKTALPASVMSATEDADGTLWFVHAFFQKGISIYDGKTFTRLETPGQLFSNNFAGVAQDAHGQIWLMSTSGETGIYSKEYLLSLGSNETLPH